MFLQEGIFMSGSKKIQERFLYRNCVINTKIKKAKLFNGKIIPLKLPTIKKEDLLFEVDPIQFKENLFKTVLDKHLAKLPTYSIYVLMWSRYSNTIDGYACKNGLEKPLEAEFLYLKEIKAVYHGSTSNQDNQTAVYYKLESNKHIDHIYIHSKAIVKRTKAVLEKIAEHNAYHKKVDLTSQL